MLISKLIWLLLRKAH